MIRDVQRGPGLALCFANRNSGRLRRKGMEHTEMSFDGFFALPTEAQAGIVAFAAALLLLVIAQLVMAASLRNRAQAATLDGLRKDVKALTHLAGADGSPRSSNGLAPPPKPLKRRSLSGLKPTE